MKEKISCSLDGELLARIDDILYKYPLVANRSALLEVACYVFFDLYDEWAHYDIKNRDAFIQRVYEMRCERNAKKESKNRNV